MTEENITLIDPTAELEESFRSMIAEYARTDEYRYQEIPELDAHGAGFAAYVQRLAAYARGEQLEDRWVPWSTYWLVRDGRTILGVVRFRHYLNDTLLAGGGHIGYDIRPSERRKGYGKMILALALDRARARGLDRVMVSCLADNIASARIIEVNGGVQDGEVFLGELGGPMKKHWIEL